MTTGHNGFKSIQDVDVSGKRILLRADLNVPLADGGLGDATRIERLLPTLRGLADRGARLVVISHLGRPKGKPNPEFSLAPVAAALGAMLDPIPVAFAKDSIGPAAESAVGSLQDGQAILLENLRFHPGEEKNDPEFARALAKLGDLYVDDAFSCSHRAHASTEAITHLLSAYAGPQLVAEINALETVLEHPKRPVAAVVGGAKIGTKIAVLNNLIEKVDQLIIGGGMANTFLSAQGIDVANSLNEPELAGTAREIMAKADSAGCEIVLPSDVVAAVAFEPNAAHQVCDVSEVPAGTMILDVGPVSLENLKGRLAACKTLLWNGPLGAFELTPFGEGTFALAHEAARLTQAGELVTVAGGGDTVAALNEVGVADDFTYVSTAGGAFLEWLEGRELPGIAALARP